MPARKAYREGCAFAEHACDRDLTAVKLDHFRDERQTNAGALMRTGSRTFDPMETVEHVRQVRGRDSNAGISNDQLEVTIDNAQRHGDAALARELQRVREQVEDDLLPEVSVDIR